MVLDSSPAKEIPKNFLEQSISLAERLSIKLCPVVKEVRKRLVGAIPSLVVDKKKKSEEMSLDRVLPATNEEAELSVAAIKAIGVDTSAIDIFPGDKKTLPKPVEDDEDEDFEEEKPDMRSVLGFLN